MLHAWRKVHHACDRITIMIDVTLATSIIYWVSLLLTMCCNSLKIGEGFRSYPIGKCFNQRSLTSTTLLKRKIIRKNFQSSQFWGKKWKRNHSQKSEKKIGGNFFSESLLENQNGFPLEEASWRILPFCVTRIVKLMADLSFWPQTVLVWSKTFCAQFNQIPTKLFCC